MKQILALLLLVGTTSYSQSAKEIWEPLLQDTNIAKFFSGMWESLGINIEETSEKLTVLHLGDHFELKDGIVESEVDYNVFLNGKSVKDMGTYGEDSKIDDLEAYKIMGTLFTPFVRASLKHAMMNKSFQQKETQKLDDEK